MEEDLKWKTTSNGRRPQIEDYLKWKTTSIGKPTQIEDELKWKTTSNGRPTQMDDNLKQKMTTKYYKGNISANTVWIQRKIYWKTQEQISCAALLSPSDLGFLNF